MRMSVSSQPHQQWEKRPFALLTDLVAAILHHSVLLLRSKFVILLCVKQSLAFIFSMKCQQYFLAWGSLVFTFKSKPQDEVIEGCSDEFSEEPVFTFLFYPDTGVTLEWPRLWGAVQPVPLWHRSLGSLLCGVLTSLLREPQVCFLSSSHVWSVENWPLRPPGCRPGVHYSLGWRNYTIFYIGPIIFPSLSATKLWF